MKYNCFILLLLFFSPLISLSLNNIFSIWMVMELNLLMFLIYLVYNNNNLYEYVMKYFLISSFSSVLFLYFFFGGYDVYIFKILMNLVLFIKLGFYPFYYWFISMMKNLSWYGCFMLSIWQKLIPMYLLSLITNKYLFMLMILINGFISVIYVLNEVELKVIMGYSSINHLCWLLVSLNFSKSLWWFYFITYLLILMFLIFLFNYFNMIYVEDMFIYCNKWMTPYLISGMMFSLGGIPATFGFMLKWNYMLQILNYNLLFLVVLIFFSLLFLYNYMRVIFVYMFDYTLTLKNLNMILNVKFYMFYMFLMVFLIFGLFMFVSSFLMFI